MSVRINYIEKIEKKRDTKKDREVRPCRDRKSRLYVPSRLPLPLGGAYWLRPEAGLDQIGSMSNGQINVGFGEP